MKVSQPAMDFLAGLITGDTNKSNYKSGPQLVQFFNGFGESDEYAQGFPSRIIFAQQKLQKFNNTTQLEDIINQTFHPANFSTYEGSLPDLINEANSIFAYEGFKLVETDRGLKIKEISSISQPVDTENQLFQKDSFRLFISHKDDNKKFANELKKVLEVFGISSFVAHEDIEPSTEWQNEIEKALFSMDSLLALLSSGFSASVWTNQEVGVAFGRGVFILSIKNGEDPKGFVGKFQALRPKSTDINDLALQIAEQMIKNQKTSEKMKTAYIHALSSTSQWVETERWATLLPYIFSISSDQAKNLIENYNSNSQAYDCFSLNGGRYGNTKNIVSYLNEWTNSNRYKLSNKKLKEVSND
ncbi:MAG: toll/interleukin-1 receptor domain-containing protein [Candidatus Hodarchaeales archaeon]